RALRFVASLPLKLESFRFGMFNLPNDSGVVHNEQEKDRYVPAPSVDRPFRDAFNKNHVFIRLELSVLLLVLVEEYAIKTVICRFMPPILAEKCRLLIAYELAVIPLDQPVQRVPALLSLIGQPSKNGHIRHFDHLALNRRACAASNRLNSRSRNFPNSR